MKRTDQSKSEWAPRRLQYHYTDRDGDELTIDRNNGGPEIWLGGTGQEWIFSSKSEARGFIDAMQEMVEEVWGE